MKAKCPHCDAGCSECERTGYIEVSFPPEGKLWLKVCLDCRSPAGGCFSGPGLSEPSISKYAVCPECGGKNLELQEAGLHR